MARLIDDNSEWALLFRNRRLRSELMLADARARAIRAMHRHEFALGHISRQIELLSHRATARPVAPKN